MKRAMKLKPTPGPWTTYTNPRMIHLASVLDHKAGGYLIENTTHANARLIAAAPELLDALQCLLDHAVSHTSIHSPDPASASDVAVQHALKAIAKAKGGAE